MTTSDLHPTQSYAELRERYGELLHPTRGVMRGIGGEAADTLLKITAGELRKIAVALAGASTLLDRCIALEEENGRLRDEIEQRDKRKAEAAQREWEYFQAATCTCTAAERYVPTCPKHGCRALLGDTK